MVLFKLFLRELGLMFAFIVLGALLLISVWVSRNVDESVLADYRNDILTVIIAPTKESDVRRLLESDPEVLSFEIQSAGKNRDVISDLYPELSQVLAPLEDGFFPMSASVVSKNAEKLVEKLNSNSSLIEASMLHEPPARLKNFLALVTIIFTGLWVLTLLLVLYFQLERLAFRSTQRWSLMKMLGAKPFRVFKPVLLTQTLRILLASFLAVFLARLASTEISAVFMWAWPQLSWGVAMVFVLSTVLLSVLFLFGMFLLRFRQVKLG